MTSPNLPASLEPQAGAAPQAPSASPVSLTPHEPQTETATSRLELVWGAPGLARLEAATVVVLGVGGVGSNCAESLARGGVGHLVLVDGDEVAPSNINRQAIAFANTVGMRKVEAARTFLGAINPSLTLTTYDRFVKADEVDALMQAIEHDAGPITYVVDAIDTVSAKLAVASWAARTGTPLISSMGGANKLDPERLRICDIFETSMDPLARVMRKECRKRDIRRLTVCCSFEAPQELPLSASPTDTTVAAAADNPADAVARPTLGTVSYLPPIMGHMIAAHVMRRIVLEPAAAAATTAQNSR